MWEGQKKKIIYFLCILSTLSYIIAFGLFTITYYILFRWNKGNEMLQISIAGVFFIIGMICAEMIGFLTISERNCAIEEDEEMWTEKERKNIEKLLLEIDD